MANGGESLYLDYWVNGVRCREFLQMYLTAGTSKIDKIRNQETMKTAVALKAKKIIELQNGQAGFKAQKKKDMALSDFIKKERESYLEHGHREYANTLTKIGRYITMFGKKTTVRTMTKEYALEFLDFLRDRGLSEWSVSNYFSNLTTVFNNAYRDGLVDENPMRRIEVSLRPKKPESVREYLTLGEVKDLIATGCRREEVKRAFLFACFTGLRLGDVEALRWESIKHSGDGWQVEAKQIKTKRMVYVPLSQNAIDQLPSPWMEEGLVWKLPDRVTIGNNLKAWVKSAGISKKITFHCSRHTYATLLLTYGADLYTVSKLLGHTNVATTQIYAKIVDEKKKQAVNLIPSIG